MICHIVSIIRHGARLILAHETCNGHCCREKPRPADEYDLTTVMVMLLHWVKNAQSGDTQTHAWRTESSQCGYFGNAYGVEPNLSEWAQQYQGSAVHE